MRSTTFAVAALFAYAAAQSIDPNSVPLADRKQWCVSQQASCPDLCAQQSSDGSLSTASNTCDPTTLDYSCVCASGLTPNATEYSQTIPYFICTEANTQCVNACSNSACQSACRQNHPCGAKDPTRVNTTSSSATTTATATGSSGSGSAATTSLDTFGGAGNGGSTTKATGTSSAIKVTAISIGQTYGFAAVVGGLIAGFGLML